MGLCKICKAFDVQPLFAAAEAAPTRENQNSSSALVSSKHGVVRDGVSQFCKHQTNLKDLRVSSEQCELCAAIWKQFQDQRKAHELTDSAIVQGVGNEQIYLGTQQWDTGLSSGPHVIAVQQGPPPHNVQRQLACFEVCAPHGKAPKQLGHLVTRLQAKSASDKQCLDLAHEWLKTCVDTHVTCRKAYESQLRFPTRILEIARPSSEDSNGKDTILLKEGSECSGAYTALSYCWGPDRDLLLSHKTQASLRAGIALSRFPPTLRDAILVTRHLGIRYIWIDALCIFQDQAEYQESRDDWARESARMRDVYRGAIVTIEAASASRGKDSFLKERAHWGPYVELHWGVEDEGMTVFLRPISDVSDNHLLGTTIFTRGWTLQERLLAPRTLSFGAQQISFECSHGFVGEIGRASALPRATESYLSKTSITELRRDRGSAAKIIRSVSQVLGLPAVIEVHGFHTRLSSQGILQIPGGYWATYFDYWRGVPALSGLADESQRATRDTYVAGMWKSELIASLAWGCNVLYNPTGEYANYPGIARSNYVNGPYPESAKSDKYIAPSWSWASVQGRVNFLLKPYYEKQDFAFYAKLKSVQTVAVHSADPFGSLSGGQLELDVPFLDIPTPLEQCPGDYTLASFHGDLRRRKLQQGADYTTEFYQHHEPFEGQTFGLIKLLHENPRTDEFGKWLYLLLIETCPDGGYRRLTDVKVQLATFDELERGFYQNVRVVSESDIAAFESTKPFHEETARISREIIDAPWKRKRLTLY